MVGGGVGFLVLVDVVGFGLAVVVVGLGAGAVVREVVDGLLPVLVVDLAGAFLAVDEDGAVFTIEGLVEEPVDGPDDGSAGAAPSWVAACCPSEGSAVAF